MAKEGIAGDDAVNAHYKAICDIVDGDVSAEVIATDFEGMVREGEALAALHENIVVKVPMISEGIKAISHFTEKGIRTNCTLIFSPGQALIAAKAGASYVSPFIGRLDDISSDGMDLIEDIRNISTTTILGLKASRRVYEAPCTPSNARNSAPPSRPVRRAPAKD